MALTPATIPALLARHGLRPSRALGQNFLADPNTARRIARLAQVQSGDRVLEIGPGIGSLTVALLEAGAAVTALELDEHVIPALEETVGTDAVQIVRGDALRVDFDELLPVDGRPWCMVSNLPYNVATPIVAESLAVDQLQSWCVMVQREVADRFFAVPSTKAYGSVSVLVQLATERTGLHAVSRDVFRPRPNVDSALVGFRRVAPAATPRVKKIVEAAFAHRRKTLANSLALSNVSSRERAVEALDAIGRLPSARAEELSPPEFVGLAEALA